MISPILVQWFWLTVGKINGIATTSDQSRGVVNQGSQIIVVYSKSAMLQHYSDSIAAIWQHLY